MIITKIKGGLGNQMFQYAVGKSAAKKNNTSFLLDLTYLNHRLPRRSNHVFRNYDLDVFNIHPKTTILSKAPKFLANPAYILQRGIDSIHKIFSSTYIIKETKIYGFDANVYDQASCSLDGYWQNINYLENIESELKNEFTSFRYPLSSVSEEMAKKMSECDSVSINFRRTDYVSDTEMYKLYGHINNGYYQKAISKIGEKISDPTFFVFSDDIEWCKKNFKTDYKTIFVGPEHDGFKNSESFRLMMLCKNNIISNSTFAWWAAWLNNNPSKLVIAPEIWINDPNIKKVNLFPKEWIQI